MLPSSEECCRRSRTLMALLRASSTPFLRPAAAASRARPSPAASRVNHACWCNFKRIRIALPTGPWPCRFGRKEDKIELPPLLEDDEVDEEKEGEKEEG